MIPSIVQLLFFVSPVMWPTPSTGRLNLLSSVNPIAWTLEAIRGLVLSSVAQPLTQLWWLGMVGVMVLCTVLISPFTKHIRLRI